MKQRFILITYAMIALGSWVWGQEATIKESEGYKRFKPHIQAEAALTVARAAVVRAKYNTKLFEVHDLQHYSELPVDWSAVTEAKRNGEDKASPQLLELRRDFGVGPVWMVNYWKTERVSHSGLWLDDLVFGISVIVYGPQKVAVIDRRTVEGKDDKIP